MKKLVLLVSVFLLLTGMVFADVTFAPEVTGEASVTWGLDLENKAGWVNDTYVPELDKMNSGFKADNKATIDLGVTIDPFDAKSGEDGMYGEIELTGMGVTAKDDSSADDDNAVTVTAPTVTAKLYFMEGLYMRVCTNPAPNYDVVSPLGNLITIDDNKEEGSWYESDDDDLGSTVESKWGNAGYGITYMMDALTVNADFVSISAWGQEDYKKDGLNRFKEETYNKGDADGGNQGDDDTISAAELANLAAMVENFDGVVIDGTTYHYEVRFTEVYIDSTGDGASDTTVYELPIDGDYIQIWKYKDGKTDTGEFVSFIDLTGKVNDSLYTLGVDVTYDMDGIGSFMAYVIPGHENQWNTFSKFGYGGKITIDAVEMVTPVVAADFKYDETNGFIGKDKRDILEWEAYVELPVSYEVSEDVSVDATVKMAATDKSTWAAGNDKYLDERVVYDIYASAGADVMGASVDAAYMVTEAFYEEAVSSSMKVGASYALDAMGGTITPSADWAVDFNGKTKGNEEGYLTVAVAAAVVDNTTFTLKYASGDLLENPYDSDEHDMGVITFETKIAY